MMGNNVPLRDRLLSASDVTTDILSLTAPETVSLLPTDLNSTNLVLAGVIELLEESLDSAENTSDISNSVRTIIIHSGLIQITWDHSE